MHLLRFCDQDLVVMSGLVRIHPGLFGLCLRCLWARAWLPILGALSGSMNSGRGPQPTGGTGGPAPIGIPIPSAVPVLDPVLGPGWGGFCSADVAGLASVWCWRCGGGLDWPVLDWDGSGPPSLVLCRVSGTPAGVISPGGFLSRWRWPGVACERTCGFPVLLSCGSALGCIQIGMSGGGPGPSRLYPVIPVYSRVFPGCCGARGYFSWLFFVESQAGVEPAACRLEAGCSVH